MSLKETIEKINKTTDLNTYFPNYFNKRIFQTIIVLMFILWIISFATNDYQFNNVWVECPNTSIQCHNPFYLCSHYNQSINPFQMKEYTCLSEINWKIKPLCDKGICDREYLNSGEIIGNKPDFLNANFTLIILGMIIAGFIINHIEYKIKKK